MNILRLLIILNFMHLSCESRKAKIDTINKENSLITTDANNMSAIHSKLSRNDSLYIDWLVERNTPDKINELLKNSSYKVSTKLNPFYLRGHFFNPNINDFVVLIENKTNGKLGFFLLDSKKKQISYFRCRYGI